MAYDVSQHKFPYINPHNNFIKIDILTKVIDFIFHLMTVGGNFSPKSIIIFATKDNIKLQNMIIFTPSLQNIIIIAYI